LKYGIETINDTIITLSRKTNTKLSKLHQKTRHRNRIIFPYTTGWREHKTLSKSSK